MNVSKVCLLGLGEVGSTLADDLSGKPVSLTAWDRAFDDPASRAAVHLADRPHLKRAADAASAAAGCELVISAVTAAEDLAAATSIIPSLEPGALFVDLNSVAPETRRRVAAVVEEAGGRYVEVAVMAPIASGGVRVAMLAGGPHARTLVPIAEALGFSGMSVCDDEIGKASATKMCRSVMVKGLEALVTESLLAARHYGVDDTVIASLSNVIPHEDWNEYAHYLVTRALEHGGRRAEEMREVAITVRDAGIDSWMSEATVERQDEAAGYSAALDADEIGQLLDRIIELRGKSST